MLVELSVLLFDSCGEFIWGKRSSLIAYRVDWYVNHRLQFVGRPKEEEEKKKRRKRGRKFRFPCITVAVYIHCFGSAVR